MISLKTENISSVVRDLGDLTDDLETEMGATLTEVGRFVESEAKLRTPVSPTKAQAATEPFYHYDKKKSPGTLRDSITIEKGRDYVDVGVMSGGAMDYADVIHNKFGKSWHRIGPGSVAQSTGRTIGGKFIDRAYDDNKAEISRMFETGVDVAVEKFNDGN